MTTPEERSTVFNEKLYIYETQIDAIKQLNHLNSNKSDKRIFVFFDDIWNKTDNIYILDVTEWNSSGHPGGSVFEKYHLTNITTKFNGVDAHKPGDAKSTLMKIDKIKFFGLIKKSGKAGVSDTNTKNNYLLHIFIGLTWLMFMIWIFSLPKKVPLRLKIHPVLMFTGYFLLFFEGYVVYRLPNYETMAQDKKINTHAALNISALLFAIVGVMVLFTEKGRIHMYSVHSWIGAFTTLLYASNAVLGYLSRKGDLDIKWHRLVGNVTFILICVSLLSGIQNLTSIMIRSLGFEKRSIYITSTYGIVFLFMVSVFFEQHQFISY
jgi:hypothetical protein